MRYEDLSPELLGPADAFASSYCDEAGVEITSEEDGGMSEAERTVYDAAALGFAAGWAAAGAALRA